MNYTPARGRIVIATCAEGDDADVKVGFSVQDNGPGIDNDDLPHLFDRFYRGKAAQVSGARGTGLGLSIVKSIVNRHGGLIEVENVSGGGAKFTVWLPVEQEKKHR
jgi:two-component system sensor histidine kinase BaeS